LAFDARMACHDSRTAPRNPGRSVLPSQPTRGAVSGRAAGFVWGTAASRPPFMATVSLWSSDEAAAAYAYGDPDAGHPRAITKQRRNDLITSQPSSATPRWVSPARFEACQRRTLATTRHNPGHVRCRRPNFVVAPARRRVDRRRLRFPGSSDTHAAPPITADRRSLSKRQIGSSVQQLRGPRVSSEHACMQGSCDVAACRRPTRFRVW
jgi:hypothetical protein